MASTWIIDPLGVWTPLRPVRLPPSMIPPEMLMRVWPLGVRMAAVAVVAALIWMVPFSRTAVLLDSISGLAPTTKVPFRWRTMTLLGFALRAAS
jgi:hypothetical protein